MYNMLEVAWASSLLRFFQPGHVLYPLRISIYGKVIRSRSKLCLYLKELKDKEDMEKDNCDDSALSGGVRAAKSEENV